MTDVVKLEGLPAGAEIEVNADSERANVTYQEVRKLFVDNETVEGFISAAANQQNGVMFIVEMPEDMFTAGSLTAKAMLSVAERFGETVLRHMKRSAMFEAMLQNPAGEA